MVRHPAHCSFRHMYELQPYLPSLLPLKNTSLWATFCLFVRSLRAYCCIGLRTNLWCTANMKMAQDPLQLA